MTDPDWVKANPDQARAIYKQHKPWLDSFARCLYVNTAKQKTLDELAAWVKDRAKEGCRVLAIDPITLASQNEKASWVKDQGFLDEVKRTVVEFNCSIVLVTHPVKAVSFPDMTQLAGGAAYQRFAQTIVWLENHDMKTSQVKMACGTVDTEHNRTLHILKARNAKGTGIRLACTFQAESLTLTEEGIILKKKNK